MLGALEMHESPEVAILQHASGVMQVAHNAFENGSMIFYPILKDQINPFQSHISPTSFISPSSLLSAMVIALLYVFQSPNFRSKLIHY